MLRMAFRWRWPSWAGWRWASKTHHGRRLGAAALGAGSLGAMLFYPIAICGTVFFWEWIRWWRRRRRTGRVDCRRTLVNGVWLSLALAPFLALAILLLIRCSAPPEQCQCDGAVRPFLKRWRGACRRCFSMRFRRYLQAINVVKPVTFALVSATRSTWWQLV